MRVFFGYFCDISRQAQYEDREFRDADWPLGNPHVGEVATAVNVNAPEGLGSIPRGDKASVHYRFGASVSEFPWFPLEKVVVLRKLL